MAATPAGYVDAGSPPPVAYSLPESAAYDLGGAGDGGGGGGQFSGGVDGSGVGVGGGEPFGVGGDGEQLGGGGGDDMFSGMPLQVGYNEP